MAKKSLLSRRKGVTGPKLILGLDTMCRTWLKPLKDRYGQIVDHGGLLHASFVMTKLLFVSYLTTKRWQGETFLVSRKRG